MVQVWPKDKDIKPDAAQDRLRNSYLKVPLTSSLPSFPPSLPASLPPSGAQ